MDSKTLFTGLHAALSFRYNPENELEKQIVDMLWVKLYTLCKDEKDIELAFVAATSISDENKRESALGTLIEDLIVNDTMSSLFKCKLSNKNLQITADFLKKRLDECLWKLTQNKEGKEKSEFFKADKIFIKLFKALHSIFTFYTKPRESCQYMLNIVFQLQDYKYKSHINILNILQIEQYLLSLIMVVTRTFDNPDEYIFYIKDNDIYNIMKRRQLMDEDMNEVEDTITQDMVSRFFAINTSEGKYIIKLKDIEAYAAKNEAQLKVYERCGEFLDETEELIDF